MWLNDLLNLSSTPPTIRILYGNPEHLFPPEYETVIYDLLAELGVRGVSTLVASGGNVSGGGGLP